MKLSRFVWLLIALPVLTGCETAYTHLRVTKPRGELIADWVARGHISHVETGYRISAMERTDGPPSRGTTRYPDGWRVTVAGPYIHRWRCARPVWLEADSK